MCDMIRTHSFEWYAVDTCTAVIKISKLRLYTTPEANKQ